MTRTNIQQFIDYCNEAYDAQWEATTAAFDRFTLYEIVARDCRKYGTMDAAHLDTLYRELELSLEMAKEFLEQLGVLCEIRKDMDLAEADRKYYEEHPEELEEE